MNSEKTEALSQSDRLFAEGCPLCGGEPVWLRARGPHEGTFFCDAHHRSFRMHTDEGSDAFDAELTRRKSLASTKPEPKWEPKVGDWVSGEIIATGMDPGSAVVGEFKGFGTHTDEPIGYIRVGTEHDYQTRYVTRSSVRPANAPGSATFRCAACGAEWGKLNAYTRPNLCGGASTCKDCHFGPTPQPVEPTRPKRDPYVCHRETMASILSGSPYELSGQLERSIALQTEKKAAVKARHLADFDRSVKPKYPAAPSTWPDDSEYKGQA